MNIMSLFALSTGVAVFMLGMMLIKHSLGENFTEKSEKLLKLSAITFLQKLSQKSSAGKRKTACLNVNAATTDVP